MTAQPVPYLVLDGFLADDAHARLIDLVTNHVEFTPASVEQPGGVARSTDTTVRSATVSTPGDDVFDIFAERLEAILPHARRETGVARFRLGKIERQITAHQNSDFFGVHTDLGEQWRDSASRRLSYVYYFHEHPKRFEGGELRLYDQFVDEHGIVHQADTFQTIEPADNTIVFFPSTAFHEVRPVSVPGDPNEPGSTRFTFNGWFHDADHEFAVPPMDRVTRTNLTERFTPTFTDTGFTKMATPPAVHRALRRVYDERIASPFQEEVDEEYLPTGSPDFINIDDVKNTFQFALQALHEEWSGQELEPTAAYGLRVYRDGQSLLPHTDRLDTHVISSIVHIAHDTDEPWPLWIKDLDGNEHEVVLEEGEMILYESARCPHGRPTPMRGRSYCSLFLHYRPIDWNVSYRQLVDEAIAANDLESIPEALRTRVGDT